MLPKCNLSAFADLSDYELQFAMDYTLMIDQERAKLDLLRAKHALLASQISDSELLITVLAKRAGDAGDELDKFLERELAKKSGQSIQTLAVTAEGINASADGQKSYEFPTVRSDSIWPYVIRLMTAKPVWKVDEIISFALQNKLVKTDSAIRSTMSSLKAWDFVENDMPGLFSLKPKGLAFANTLVICI